MDGSLDRLCDPPGRIFSDSESRTAPKSAQENPVSVSADEKILKAQSNAATKNANLRQQIRSVVYNQEYYLQNVINKQKYPNRTNLPDKQGEYAKLFILRLYPQAAVQRLRP